MDRAADPAVLKRRMYWLLGLTFIHVVGEGGLGFVEALRTGSLALLVLGSLLRRHCFRMLGDSFTGAVRVQAGQEVIERGAYRYVRHPSYTAGMLMYVGVGLALSNWLSLLVLVLATAIVYGYRVSVEERALVATLGERYVAYVRRTKRFVPFVF